MQHGLESLLTFSVGRNGGGRAGTLSLGLDFFFFGGLDILNNFSRLGYRAGSQLPGTWLWGGLGQGEYWLACENLIKGMVGGVDSGLVVLYTKGMLPGASFAISGN